jgi:hypothetical protein
MMTSRPEDLVKRLRPLVSPPATTPAAAVSVAPATSAPSPTPHTEEKPTPDSGVAIDE